MAKEKFYNWIVIWRTTDEDAYPYWYILKEPKMWVRYFTRDEAQAIVDRKNAEGRTAFKYAICKLKPTQEAHNDTGR